MTKGPKTIGRSVEGSDTLNEWTDIAGLANKWTGRLEKWITKYPEDGFRSEDSPFQLIFVYPPDDSPDKRLILPKLGYMKDLADQIMEELRASPERVWEMLDDQTYSLVQARIDAVGDRGEPGNADQICIEYVAIMVLLYLCRAFGYTMPLGVDENSRTEVIALMDDLVLFSNSLTRTSDAAFWTMGYDTPPTRPPEGYFKNTGNFSIGNTISVIKDSDSQGLDDPPAFTPADSKIIKLFTLPNEPFGNFNNAVAELLAQTMFYVMQKRKPTEQDINAQSAGIVAKVAKALDKTPLLMEEKKKLILEGIGVKAKIKAAQKASDNETIETEETRLYDIKYSIANIACELAKETGALERWAILNNAPDINNPDWMKELLNVWEELRESRFAFFFASNPQNLVIQNVMPDVSNEVATAWLAAMLPIIEDNKNLLNTLFKILSGIRASNSEYLTYLDEIKKARSRASCLHTDYYALRWLLISRSDLTPAAVQDLITAKDMFFRNWQLFADFLEMEQAEN